jgi:hypothetical protein
MKEAAQAAGLTSNDIEVKTLDEIRQYIVNRLGSNPKGLHGGILAIIKSRLIRFLAKQEDAQINAWITTRLETQFPFVTVITKKDRMLEVHLDGFVEATI